MTKNLKTIFSFLILIAIVVHFSIVLVYTNPVFELKGKTKFYTQWYVYPFFDQGWKLFAPVPTTNYHLFVKFNNGNKTEQFDLVQILLDNHLKNRFGLNEALSLAIHNSIHGFETSTNFQNKLKGPIKNDVTYTVVKHLVNQYLAYYTNNQAKNIQSILLVENVITHQQRVYFE